MPDKSVDTAVVTEEPISCHTPDISVPLDDVCQSGCIDFIDDFLGVGMFIPKSIPVSECIELLCSDGGSKFSKVRPIQLFLPKHSSIKLNVINMVVNSLIHIPIILILEKQFKTINFLQPIGLSNSIIS